MIRVFCLQINARGGHTMNNFELFNMQPLFTVQNCERHWSKLIKSFRYFSRHLYNPAVILSNTWLWSAVNWKWSQWLFWIFTSAKVIIYQSIHLSQLAWFLTQRFDTRSKFRAFQTRFWSLGFSCTLRRFCTVFLSNFSKWIDTLSYIHWIPD